MLRISGSNAESWPRKKRSSSIMWGLSCEKTAANAGGGADGSDSVVGAALLKVGWTLGRKSEMTNQYSQH